jgi:hypothetical protein
MRRSARCITTIRMERCDSSRMIRQARRLLRTQQHERSAGGSNRDRTELRISGDAARYNHREGNDDFSQPGALIPPVRRGAAAAAVQLPDIQISLPQEPNCFCTSAPHPSVRHRNLAFSEFRCMNTSSSSSWTKERLISFSQLEICPFVKTRFWPLALSGSSQRYHLCV